MHLLYFIKIQYTSIILYIKSENNVNQSLIFISNTKIVYVFKNGSKTFNLNFFKV